MTDVPYNAFKDFAPMSLMIDVRTALVVSPQLDLSSVKELVERCAALSDERFVLFSIDSEQRRTGDLPRSGLR